MMGEFQMAVDGNGEVVTTAPAPVTVDGVAHKPGVFVADVSGYRWLVCRTCTDDALMPAWPCDAVAAAESPAGPVPAFKVGRQVLNRTTDQVGVVVEPGTRVAVQYSGDPGVVAAGAEWENPDDLVRLTDALAQAEDSAGPASSSASTSGTGGLAEVDALLARLEAATAALTAHTRALREQLEGQRRAVWDSLVESARRQEQVPSDTQAGYTMGWRAAHDLLTGRHLEDHEYEALLAAELDSRYGTDRAKGGGSDGA